MKFSDNDRFLVMTRKKGSLSWLQILEHLPYQVDLESRIDRIIHYLEGQGVAVTDLPPEPRRKELIERKRVGSQKVDPRKTDESTWLYMREMGRIPLLSREREHVTAEGMLQAYDEIIRTLIGVEVCRIEFTRQIAKVHQHRVDLNDFVRTDLRGQEETQDLRDHFLQLFGYFLEAHEESRVLRQSIMVETEPDRLASMREEWDELVSRMEELFVQIDPAPLVIDALMARFERFAAICEVQERELQRIETDFSLGRDEILMLWDKVRQEPTGSAAAPTLGIGLRRFMLEGRTVRRVRNAERRLEEWTGNSVMDILAKREVVTQAQSRYIQAKQELVQANIRMVISIAKRYNRNGMELGDLIQEGNNGLIRAVEKFDPTRGFKLGTYAVWWIKQYIQRYVQDAASLVRLPGVNSMTQRKISLAERDLSHEHQRAPSMQELADRTQMPLSKVAATRDLRSMVISLDQRLNEDSSQSLSDVLADPAAETQFSDLSLDLLRHRFHDVLKTLTLKEQRVLVLRYGLEDNYPRTLEEIGQIFGLTRERVRQIEQKALRKLRRPSRKDRLVGFL